MQHSCLRTCVRARPRRARTCSRAACSTRAVAPALGHGSCSVPARAARRRACPQLPGELVHAYEGTRA
eukprot:11921677-Alexandrium_andersonii.AAC.1